MEMTFDDLALWMRAVSDYNREVEAEIKNRG